MSYIVWDASTTAVGAKCPGDMLNLCVSTNATCGTVIEFYNGPSASFNPYAGEGNPIGSATIPCLPPTGAPGGAGIDSDCPYISGIMADACNGPSPGIEADNEFGVFGTGHNPIMIDNLNLDLPNSCANGDVTTGDSDDFFSNFIAGSLSLASMQPPGCPTLLQIIDDGATIPEHQQNCSRNS